MSGHVINQVSKDELRDDTEARIRELAAELDFVGDLDMLGVRDETSMFVSPGPVSQAFLNDRTPTAVLMGPLGGGKTTTCSYKVLLLATESPIAWHPMTNKPTRMSRGIVLRDTFRIAEKTVLGSWQQWFPRNYPGSASFGGNDRPFVHTLNFIGSDGIRIEAVTEFAGLGENSVATQLKGGEYSVGWLNETNTHSKEALPELEQRLGRWPPPKLVLSPREIERLEDQLGHKVYQPERAIAHAMGDMNAPTFDNWTYEALVTSRGPDRAFHQQPSGRSPEAENLFNLPGGEAYYERIVRNQDERFVRMMVDNEFGYSLSGKPVYQGFDHRRHVSSHPLEARDELDLHIGVDASTGGLSPAAVFGQSWTPRIAVVGELFVGQGVGPARFGEALQAYMNEHHPNRPRSRVKLWLDPASQYGADTEGGQQTAQEMIAAALQVPAMIPGNGNNELAFRLSAMEAEFRGYLEANSSLIICPKACPLFVQTCSSKYRFKKKPEHASNEYDDVPEKSHPWSDIADGGQYVVIGIRGLVPIIRGAVSGLSQALGRAQFSTQSGGGAPSRGRGGFDPHRVGTRG